MNHLLCIYASLFVMTALPADNPPKSLYAACSPRHGIAEWFSVETLPLTTPYAKVIVLHGQKSDSCERSFLRIHKETWHLSAKHMENIVAVHKNNTKLFALLASLAGHTEIVKKSKKIRDECCTAY